LNELAKKGRIFKMSIHMIALVGKQPMPIMIPLWQQPKKITSIQFVSTKATIQQANMLADVVKADKDLKHIYVDEHIIVGAYDLDKTRTKVASTIKKNRNKTILVNYTSGTKVMSSACLLATQDHEDSMLVYVSTEENQLLFYRPKINEEIREVINIKIDANQYFRAHGLETSLHPNFTHSKPPVQPPKAGDALEKFAYNICKQSKLFDDVQKNLFFRKKPHEGIESSDEKNELDLVVTFNGNLAVCSCKSGNLENEAIYELTAISRTEAMGIYCSRFLITNTARKDIPKIIKDRSKTGGIILISKEDLPNLPMRIKTYLER